MTTGSFLGAARWKLSPQANFGGAALLGVIGTLFYVWTLQKKPDASQNGSNA